MTASTIIRTRITSMFGCKYPLILPGMSWISTPELVAAVSNAGGVGILATGPLNETQTREAIQTIRTLSDKPFGIGATLLMPGAEQNAKVALEEQVPIINVSLGKPDWIVDACHDYGGKVLCTVVNSKHAEKAVNAGADALMVTGHEAAAHGGDVTSLVLIPSIASRFPSTPIVAAGGFANGKGLMAALSLGADAIAMGSRFATTMESPLATHTKHVIANPNQTQSHNDDKHESTFITSTTENDTIYSSNFDGIPARVLKTKTSIQVNQRPAFFPKVCYRAWKAAQILDIPIWKLIPGLLTQYDKMYTIAQFGAATEAIKAATVDGDLDEKGVQFIGQCQGLIHDIPTVDDLITRIMEEAIEVTHKNAAKFDLELVSSHYEEKYGH